MKRASFWLENAMGGTHALVDMGYVDEQRVRDSTDRLSTVLPKGNIQIVGNNRVTVRIPPKRIDDIMAAFPEIKTGNSYSFCTHSWQFGEKEIQS